MQLYHYSKYTNECNSRWSPVRNVQQSSIIYPNCLSNSQSKFDKQIVALVIFAHKNRLISFHVK